MNEDKFIVNIADKLHKTFKPSFCKVIDETYKHQQHINFTKNKYYLKIIIKSNMLNIISLLEAHKKIYSCLGELMKTKIHSISIQLKKD